MLTPIKTGDQHQATKLRSISGMDPKAAATVPAAYTSTNRVVSPDWHMSSRNALSFWEVEYFASLSFRYVGAVAKTTNMSLISTDVLQLLGVVFAHMLAKAVRRIKTEIEMENQASRHRFYAELVAEKENKDKLSSTLYSSSDA